MKVLVLSPHTDDAELGCGGSIVKLLEDGAELLWIVFSIAEESVPETFPKDAAKKEFMAVAEYLGLDESNYRIHNLKVRLFPKKRQDILQALIDTRKEFSPDIVFTPTLNDFHQDHQVVANETIRAFKRDSSILGYELPWNNIASDARMFIRLNRSQIERKYSMLKLYRSQFEKHLNYFSEEFIFGLAKMRGIQCNSDYAESFEVIRWMM